MGFFLEKAIFVNRAPFERLELDFKDKGVNVLSAINGRGKTTILSHIVDAFHELAKPHFQMSYEGIENKFYRVVSGIFSKEPTKSSFVYLRFKCDEICVDYMDCHGRLTENEYNREVLLSNKISFRDFADTIGREGYVKAVSNNWNRDLAKKVFAKNVQTYFPAYRYEQPAYLTDSYKVDLGFALDVQLSGMLPNPIEVVSDLPQIATWIMDVVLDWEVYRQTQPANTGNGQLVYIDKTPEAMLFENLNSILRMILSVKANNAKQIRFAISRRGSGAQRVSAIREIREKNGQVLQIQLAPNLSCLSSGEASLLCLFGEILKQGDRIAINSQLSQIHGIVLIDEVDKHLHIKLQKEILPRLFRLFPNIQFIVSSHSPFFIMGLADELSEASQIIDLDNGGITSNPRSTEQYEEVYKMMISENDRFAVKYKELEKKIKESTRPLIITEGKTDIKHIQKAKGKLGYDTFEFDCIEVECQPNGDGDLEKLLGQLSKVRQGRKIIGVFDRDNDDLVKRIESQGTCYKDYGNNVYAFCIQAPECRKQKGQDKISIEFLYSDEEIKSDVGNGTRLFIGTEFSGKSMRHSTEKKLVLHMPDGRGKFKILENNGGQAVYDEGEKNHLAKKDEFAEAVVNERIEIQDQSWENFRHIFEKIKKILQEQ